VSDITTAAGEWRARPWLGFDLETTGRDQATARIITAALVNADDVSASQTWLVNPGIPIPPESTAVHGITDDMARAGGQDPVVACTAIAESLRQHWQAGGVVVAYNAQYDFTVLVHELRRHGCPNLHVGPVLDPLVLWRGVEKYRKGKKRLADAIERFGVPLNTKEHDAMADAVATLAVMRALADHEELIAVDAWSIPEIMDLQQTWHRRWAEDFAAWFTQQGKDASGVDPSWPVGGSVPQEHESVGE
jgi:DNA polymerase III subunit epsilon